MLLGKRGKVIGNKFSSCFSGGQHFQNLPNHNSGSFESKFAMADGRVSDDVLVDSDSHKNNINDYCAGNYTNKKTALSNGNDDMHKRGIEGGVLEVNCPYCQSANYVKRGLRQKKLETIQLYLCNDCRRTFTPKAIKGKRYPLSTILNAISLYNLGYSLEKVCQGISQIGRLAAEATGALSANPKGTKDAISAGTSVKNEGNIGVGTLGSVTASTVSNWIAQFAPLCRFLRFRGYALQKFRIKDFIETVTLAHRQLYRFRYHRAKMAMMMLDDFRHRKFKPLEEFLEMVSSECPHQYFQEGLRASEVPLFFSKKEKNG